MPCNTLLLWCIYKLNNKYWKSTRKTIKRERAHTEQLIAACIPSARKIETSALLTSTRRRHFNISFFKTHWFNILGLHSPRRTPMCYCFTTITQTFGVGRWGWGTYIQKKHCFLKSGVCAKVHFWKDNKFNPGKIIKHNVYPTIMRERKHCTPTTILLYKQSLTVQLLLALMRRACSYCVRAANDNFGLR